MAEAYGVRGIPPSHGPGRIRDFVQGGGWKNVLSRKKWRKSSEKVGAYKSKTLEDGSYKTLEVGGRAYKTLKIRDFTDGGGSEPPEPHSPSLSLESLPEYN